MNARSHRRLIVLASVALAIQFLGANATIARAQSGQRQYSRNLRNRPTVSPYTSLINTGGAGVDNGSLSFYNIVRPQQRAQKVARSFGTELQGVESKLKTLKQSDAQSQTTNSDAVNSGRMAPTGHRVKFGELSAHYPGAAQSK